MTDTLKYLCRIQNRDLKASISSSEDDQSCPNVRWNQTGFQGLSQRSLIIFSRSYSDQPAFHCHQVDVWLTISNDNTFGYTYSIMNYLFCFCFFIRNFNVPLQQMTVSQLFCYCFLFLVKILFQLFSTMCRENRDSLKGWLHTRFNRNFEFHNTYISSSYRFIKGLE